MSNPLLGSSYDDLHQVTSFLHITSTDSEAKYISTWDKFVIHCRNGMLDIYAACVIFWFHLVSLESCLVVAIAIFATSGYYYLGERSDGSNFGANISWVIVSFAIVSPMIMQIRQAFTRRESALDIVAEREYLSYIFRYIYIYCC